MDVSRAPLVIDLNKILQQKAPKLYRKLPRFIISLLNRILHVAEMNKILSLYADKDGVDFMQAVVAYFNIRINLSGLDEVPENGRYIFASNHPLGGLDGICLSAVLGQKYNKRIKYVVNDILYYIRNLQSIFLPVNKHGRQSKVVATMIKQAYDSDVQVITFPAGLCSRKENGRIADAVWHKNFIVNAIDSQRDIVPVYFDGKNSSFFYRVARWRKKLGIKFNLEMVLLPHEMFKNRNAEFTITFGKPIPYTFFDKSKNIGQSISFVRQEVYKLAETNQK